MAAFSGFLFLITLYLQEVRGYRPLVAGLFLLPMAVAMAVSAPLCGRMLARSGPRLPLVIAGTGITARRGHARRSSPPPPRSGTC